ncbi:3'(2'),5'-bisphosphate nucleotidase CysQ [Aureibacter tunicatorum]|uniref:3'(2'),5'-bisphosphate nucleotidase CysQ n=1 Tax=Aureibacter tunicatorum TaxID=866807 RepID=A0AAE3XQG9_9BACT|nr:3'(2'),5'-bisphosphate nucleotidase CysQ [Aureibacter tunicatorum]MDR6240164.1 3'(2'), 5'-bisphosphate nucleotidase [Aureibacter tunicatorum]BDD05955.1 3'(2'),5'-bisphosphate nucleotidase CysQ [Aureibacter tunicatorum]
MSYSALAEELAKVAKQAGQAILEIYNDPAQSECVDYKADDSPLTLADKASHVVIAEGLEKLCPEIPVISEEGEQLDYQQRKDWKKFFLVDPLDGTKEFIKRNGEFTVNIALLENNVPLIGIIYVPVHDIMYIGIVGEKAIKIDGQNTHTLLEVNNKPENRIAVRSKSHPAPEEEAVLQKYGVTEEVSVGSSLKFCMVAEGKADVYYRHGPTMEWDTAAGQAVAEAAGARVFIGSTEEKQFSYNKENLLNSSFLVLGF